MCEVIDFAARRTVAPETKCEWSFTAQDHPVFSDMVEVTIVVCRDALSEIDDSVNQAWAQQMRRELALLNEAKRHHA